MSTGSSVSGVAFHSISSLGELCWGLSQRWAEVWDHSSLGETPGLSPFVIYPLWNSLSLIQGLGLSCMHLDQTTENLIKLSESRKIIKVKLQKEVTSIDRGMRSNSRIQDTKHQCKKTENCDEKKDSLSQCTSWRICERGRRSWPTFM